MVSYSYDESGNLLKKVTSLGAAPTVQITDETKYAWESEDRLISVTEAAHTATPQTTSYVYNGFGERIEEVASGATPLINRTTRYIFDHSYGHAQVLEERNGSNALFAHHTVSPFPNAQGALRISELRGDVGTGEVIGNSQYRVYHQDALASTRMLTDASGTGTDFVSYLPFGKPSGRTGTSGTRFLFTGEQQGVAGLTYLRARHLDVGQGRFLGMDSYVGDIFSPVNVSRYIYGYNNPVSAVDPSGYSPLLSMSISVNTSHGMRGLTTHQGKRLVSRILFGHPPKDVGFVGEQILNWMIDGSSGHLFDSAGTKIAYGQNVHAYVRKACRDFGGFNDVTLLCEPFYAKDGKTEGNPKGSLGVDVVIKYKTKAVIALELKTGRGMSKAGFENRRKFSGLSVIQITIRPTQK